MCSAREIRELAVLLRISREFDIVGDVSLTVDEPSELLAWALALSSSSVIAWRTADGGRRYVQVSAQRQGPPIRGRVAAVLRCDRQQQFWDALGLSDLQPGDERNLDAELLSAAWAVIPLALDADGRPIEKEGAKTDVAASDL